MFLAGNPGKIVVEHEVATDITYRHLVFIQPGHVAATGS
jgi:hypothetical protein